MKYNNSYHIVNSSPWPLTVSISLMSLIISLIMAINYKIGSKELAIISIISLSYSIYKWFKEIIIESTYKGEHTEKVQELMKTGLILFIISEIVIFGTLFYCLFYIYYIPSIECNNLFLPLGIDKINWESIPLLNTILLLFGSVTITAAQYTLILKDKKNTKILFIITILLNLIFNLLQVFEYKYSSFTLTDSFYGNIFYSLTFLHFTHVFIGTLIIFAGYSRISHYTNSHHILSNFSSLYNHFVDVVWIVLFILVYLIVS